MTEFNTNRLIELMNTLRDAEQKIRYFNSALGFSVVISGVGSEHFTPTRSGFGEIKKIVIGSLNERRQEVIDQMASLFTPNVAPAPPAPGEVVQALNRASEICEKIDASGRWATPAEFGELRKEVDQIRLAIARQAASREPEAEQELCSHCGMKPGDCPMGFPGCEYGNEKAR
jgi:hypothetical protein